MHGVASNTLMMVLLRCLLLGGDVVVGYSTCPSPATSLLRSAPRIPPRFAVGGSRRRAGGSSDDDTRSLWTRFGGGSPPRWPAAASTAVSATITGSTGVSASSGVVATVDDASDAMTTPRTRYDSVIVGGGPAGLLCAIMLAQKRNNNVTTSSGDDAKKIAVYDRLPPPPDPTDESAWRGDDSVARFYLIGLGHRGQAALEKFGVLDEVKAASVAMVGRRDWQPGAGPDEGVERIDTSRKPVTTVVLPRDKLVGVLRRHIEENYPSQISMHHDRQVVPVSFGNGTDYSVTLSVSRCVVAGGNSSSSMPPQAECDLDGAETVETNFLVGADGAARTVANEMERRDAERIAAMGPLRRPFARPGAFKVRRFVDDNKRVYKTVPVRLPDDGGWRFDLNYSARSRNSSRVTFEALPSDDRGTYCALLLMREGGELARPDGDPSALRRFFDDEFPQFSALLDDDAMGRVAEKPASDLPAFRYAGPRLNEGDRTILLGDCAHTVKPYFGLGANTALEDVSVLSDVIDETLSSSSSSLPAKETARAFSERRAGESAAIVTISRNMDRPGRLGLAMFIGPIILDGIFHGLAPALFAPNMFAMFQREGSSFRAMQRRKRLDRAVQLACVVAVGCGVVRGTRAAVSLVARTLGRSDAVVGASMASSIAMAVVFWKIVASIFGNRARDDQSAKLQQSR